MSYSSDCKNSLCGVQNLRSCCVLTELSALFETMGSLSLLGRGQVSVSFTGYHLGVCRRVYSLLNSHLGMKPQLHYLDDSHFGGRRKCVLTLGPVLSPRFLQLMGMARVEEGGLKIVASAPHITFTRLCCMKSYLRGIFLGGGTVTAPQHGYHLELPIFSPLSQDHIAKSLQRLGVTIHLSSRGESRFFLISTSEGVSGLLTAMGCGSEVIALENVRLGREIMARTTRMVNCDNANARKTAAAADAALRGIALLRESGRLDALPAELREIALLRLQNPGATLTELGEMLVPPKSKATVLRRLRQVVQAAEGK